MREVAEDSDLVAAENSDLVGVVQTKTVALAGRTNRNSNTVSTPTPGYKLHCSAYDLFGHLVVVIVIIIL